MTATALRAAATGEKAPSKLAVFSGFMERFKEQLALALPKHLNADRMARLAITAFSTTPHLDECDAKSIAGSLMTAGQLGLEPGVNGQGYLIPYFDSRRKIYICTFVPGWKGLVDLVARAGRATVWTGVVMPGDEFDYQLGDSPYCRHKPGDNFDDGITGGWTHVYAIGRVRGAEMPVIEVWTRGKVTKHLNAYNKVGDRHYGKTNENNFEKYGRKVALLQVLKYMPQSIELATATRIADMSDTGKGVVVEGDFVSFIDEPTGEVPPPPPAPTPPASGPAPKPTAKRATGKGGVDPLAADKGGTGPSETVQGWIDGVTTAGTRDLAIEALDLARTDLKEAEHAAVAKAFHQRWGD